MTSPITGVSGSVTRKYTVVTSQQFPDSGIKELRNWIVGENWEGVCGNDHPDIQLGQFQDVIPLKLNKIFPKKIVKISNLDLPFSNFFSNLKRRTGK